MLVIATPVWSLIRVMWYSNGPGEASNFQSKSEPQNSRPLAVSSAGISKCTGWPAMATPLASVVRRSLGSAAVVQYRPVGRGELIGARSRDPDAELPSRPSAPQSDPLVAVEPAA